MKLIKLREDVTNYPKCEQLLSLNTRKFWHGRGRPRNEKGTDTCGCYASYKIGRKYFCKKHAGLYLVENFTEFRK